MRRALGVLAVLVLTGCGLEPPPSIGEEAVRVCASHGGVAALDDATVICSDQTLFEVEAEEPE